MLVGQSFDNDYHASEDLLVARVCHFKDFHSGKSAHLEECTARCAHANNLEVFKGKYVQVIADNHVSADSSTVTDTLKGRFVQADRSHLNRVEASFGASLTNSNFKVATITDGPFSSLSAVRVLAHEIKSKDRVIVSNLEINRIESSSTVQIVNSIATHVIAYNVLCGIDSRIEEATLYVTQESPQIELYNTEVKMVTLIGSGPFKPLFYGTHDFRYKIVLNSLPPATHPDLPNT